MVALEVRKMTNKKIVEMELKGLTEARKSVLAALQRSVVTRGKENEEDWQDLLVY